MNEIITTRLLKSLQALQNLGNKPPCVEQFKEYAPVFSDIYLKVKQQAADRQDSDISIAIELAWAAINPAKPLPKFVPKVKLVLYPGTSFSDAIDQLDKHGGSDEDNALTALRYLETLEIKKLPQQDDKINQANEILKKTGQFHRGNVRSISDAIVAKLDGIKKKKEDEAKRKQLENDRLKAQLEHLKKPNGAQKRALAKLTSKSTDRANNVKKSSASDNNNDLEESEEKRRRKKPQRRPMTDDEWEAEFKKRARTQNEERDREEIFSKYMGMKEDREAKL